MTARRHPSYEVMRRRQRAGVINRRLGWVLLPAIIAATANYYLDGPAYSVLRLILVPSVVLLSTVHLALSWYVFGLVRPRLTLKVFHIYFGYALGLVIWASQTNLDREPLHTYLTVLMFLGIVVHVALAVRYAALRRAA